MPGISDIVPQKTDPITGRVIRKARVLVGRLASPPTRLGTAKSRKNVGTPTPRG